MLKEYGLEGPDLGEKTRLAGLASLSSLSAASALQPSRNTPVHPQIPLVIPSSRANPGR